MSTKTVHARATNIGLVVGVLFNIYLWKGQPQIFWFWWNIIGFIVTCSIGYLGSKVISPSVSDTQKMLEVIKPDFKIPETGILIVYFAVIVMFCLWLPYLMG